MTAPLSEGAIRARASNRCECKGGACGERHRVGRCSRSKAFSQKAQFNSALVVVDGKLLCTICAAKIEARAERSAPSVAA